MANPHYTSFYAILGISPKRDVGWPLPSTIFLLTLLRDDCELWLWNNMFNRSVGQIFYAFTPKSNWKVRRRKAFDLCRGMCKKLCSVLCPRIEKICVKIVAIIFLAPRRQPEVDLSKKKKSTEDTCRPKNIPSLYSTHCSGAKVNK